VPGRADRRGSRSTCTLTLRYSKAGTPPALDPLDAEARAWPSLRSAPDQYLDWLPTDAPAASPNPGRDIAEVHPNKDTGGAEVTLRLTKRPALEVLRALAAAAALDLRAEPAVAARLADVVGPVEVERLPLDDVLSALCARADVAWAVSADVLHLTAAPAATPDRAAGALQKALAAEPPHPSAAAMRVALANLDAAAGRTRAAALGYKRVLEGPGTGRNSRPRRTTWG
jgi:hypothetical protein